MGSRYSWDQDRLGADGMQMRCATMLLLIVQCNHCIRM